MPATLLALLALFAAAAPASSSPDTSSSVGFPAATRPFYVAVSVTDIDRSAVWYEATLGLRRLDDERDPGGQWRIVNVVSDDLWVELIWDRRDQPAQNARGLVKVGFAVASVDELASLIAKRGGEPPRVVESAKHRIRIVQLTDPDGNILQFSSPMPAGGRPAGS